MLPLLRADSPQGSQPPISQMLVMQSGNALPEYLPLQHYTLLLPQHELTLCLSCLLMMHHQLFLGVVLTQQQAAWYAMTHDLLMMLVLTQQMHAEGRRSWLQLRMGTRLGMLTQPALAPFCGMCGELSV